MKNEIKNLLEQALQELDITDIPVQVEYPADPKHGDYASNVALIAAKKVGKKPRDLAVELVAVLQKNENSLLENIEIAGPGFINFTVNTHTFFKAIKQRSIPDLGKKRTVVVEYSSPNIAKPFTIGHLRSTIIGDAIANLLAVTGWEVKRDNHVGDWGTQFGKQILAVKTWGNETEIEQSENPVKALVQLYVKFHEEAEKNPLLEDEARAWFKKLEAGDSEARELWKKCIEWSWKEFTGIYQQLGVSFTENDGRGFGEAYFEDKMDAVLSELKEKGLLTKGKEGAMIVEFPEESKLPPLMILKKDGASLYATRDLATDKFRLSKYGPNVSIINEVGIEQELYFKQLYKLEELLGWIKSDQRIHIKHGHYRFKEGKMSTRKGNVVWLEDVLKEAEKRALDLQKHITEVEGNHSTTKNIKSGEAAKRNVLGHAERINLAEKVGISALKWNDLKRDPRQDIAFDWDEILNMQGNSGPYLQYVYARTQSVLNKASNEETHTKAFDTALAGNSLEPEEREVLRLLARFTDVVADAAHKYAPSTLCTYLYEVAQAYNAFYQKHQIIKAEGLVREFRLALTKATGETLKSGLHLLGIATPEKM